MKNCELLNGNYLIDSRGRFQKFYSTQNGLPFTVREIYSSTSKKGVIRGMHCQSNHDFWKAVQLIDGQIFDVLLNCGVNINSPRIETYNLSSENSPILIIPPGIYHGFQCLSNECTLNYLVGSIYNPQLEIGYNPLSIGVNWPINNYQLSKRDQNLPVYEKY